METYKGSWILPIGPRDGGQGLRHVSPVWWSSDESSYVPSGFDIRPADDFTSQDGIEDRTAQEQPVQTKAFQPSPHPARIEHDKMSFLNRLRRQPAANCLSAQYLESGGCSTHESREAGTVEKQTIRPPVATQDDRERTNHRARRSCQLPADMNQPKVVRISSGIRKVNAQTLAAMLEAGVWDDRDDSAVKENVHKANVRTSADTEDTHTRSSIASEATTATVWTGNVTANVGLVQHFEAPSISPQHAEFLNVHWRSLRHESLIRPARRDLSTPRHRIDEQNNVGRLKSHMAKFDSKARAHVKARQRPRGQAVMRPEIASRQAPTDHGVRLAKVPDSRHRSEPLGPKELPRFANSTLLCPEDIPGYLLQRGHSTGEGWLSQRQSPLATGSQDVRLSRGNFELGRARTVRFSKPGKASVVKISPHEPRPFDFGSLGLVETDLMFSAGAMAKSARRTNVQAAGTRPGSTRSSAIESAAESMPPMQRRQRSRIPRAAPGMTEHAASPSKPPVRDPSTDMDRDVRFPQLLRRLTNDARHGSVQELPRTVPSAAPAYRQLNDRWTTGKIQSSSLKHNSGRLSLNENARQSQIPNENDSMPTSPSKIVANSTTLPGHSGCPSLMSDDGQEPCDFPEAMANEDARLPISPNVPEWEKEEAASTALDETSSEGSSTLVHINMDENELFSVPDTEAIHDQNIRADEIHAGVGTSSYDERGWLFWAPQGIASPISTHYHRGDNGPGAQRRSGRRVNGRRPDDPTMYGYCAILRWLISTSDAPGTPGMRSESTPGQELLEISGEYQLRLDDNDRDEMQRTLNRISDGIEPRPGSSDEVSAFIRSMNLRSGP